MLDRDHCIDGLCPVQTRNSWRLSQQGELLYHFVQFGGHASQRPQKLRFDLVFRLRLEIADIIFSKVQNFRRIDRNGTVFRYVEFATLLKFLQSGI